MVIPGHNLGNSQVSVNRTIGPTLVFIGSSKSSCILFVMDNKTIGTVPPYVVKELKNYPDVFEIINGADKVRTVIILNFRTDRSGQTVQTQISLLLEEQSDQGLHCLLFHLHLFSEIP